MITIDHTRNQVLPLYMDINDQERFACGTIYSIKYPNLRSVSPAQIVADSAASVSNIKLIQVDGSYQASISGSVNSTTVDVDGDGVDEVVTTIDWFPAPREYQRPQGVYYFQLEVNGQTRYTETFYLYCDVTHKLTWSGCADSTTYYDDGFENVLYLDIEFRSPEYELSIEGVEDVFGNKRNVKYNRLKYYSFNLLTPDFLLDALWNINGHDNVKIERLSTGEVYEITDISIDQAGDDLSCERYSTFKFRIIDETVSKNECCNNLLTFEATPDVTCHSFTIDIDQVAETATYTVTNDPNGAPGYTPSWYYKETPQSTPVFLGNSDTIGLLGAGVYELSLASSFCTVKESINYGTIENLILTVNTNGDTLTASLSGCEGSITWDIQNDAGTSVGSSAIYTALTDGYYTVYATCDATGTTVNKTVWLSVESVAVCQHTLNISRSGLVLGQITIDKNGVYWFVSTVDGCTVKEYFVVTDYCTPISICNANEIQTNVTVNTENVTC